MKSLITLTLVLGGCAIGPAPGGEEVWSHHTRAGLAAVREGRPAEAEREFLDALAALPSTSGHERQVLATLNPLGMLYLSLGRLDGAAAVLEKALALADKRLGADDPDTLLTLRNRAAVQVAARDARGAEATVRRIAEAVEKARGPDHPETARWREELARLVEVSR